ncbi:MULTISPECIES: ABC transporter substrate-binding protein [unclassified Streptomyces]|uniref:ABC transporter substrate-binding protein n=1 Tax=unclassified Streptomyces TaxID=2593676 RepID=UPI0023671C5C|nr:MULTISPECIES: ABC transporter substrate-binding protein [unclassified Streptomyces]MDF3149578.1 ABC transporter substrate-binding protein [Streptomyces sp. T21Q-yed]WDF38099.1 ABC transporter substrate-binding protein [Streptomyces sp. T12]
MPSLPAPGVDRRLFLTSLLGVTAAAAGLTGCAESSAADAAEGASTAPLAAKVPAGTSLKIASYQNTQQLQFRLAELGDPPFKVGSWVNIGAGPDVINAFRAGSLDLANNAGIPPIQAYYQGFDAKIVAINITRKPNYLFATKPGSDIRTVEDFRGKRLAFSQGQAQGVVLLRALKKAGLEYDEVELVPLTSNQFLTALQSGQVDIAPLANQQAPAYLKQYEAKGARAITTDVVDLLNLLWAPVSVLNDPAKAAAVAAYIPYWAKGQVWTYENPDIWNEEFYVKTQNLSLAQARSISELANKPLFPPSWDEAIKWEQQTADLLAEGGFVKKFDVGGLFDHRFEGIAAKSVPAQYRR